MKRLAPLALAVFLALSPLAAVVLALFPFGLAGVAHATGTATSPPQSGSSEGLSADAPVIAGTSLAEDAKTVIINQGFSDGNGPSFRDLLIGFLPIVALFVTRPLTEFFKKKNPDSPWGVEGRVTQAVNVAINLVVKGFALYYAGSYGPAGVEAALLALGYTLVGILKDVLGYNSEVHASKRGAEKAAEGKAPPPAGV